MAYNLDHTVPEGLDTGHLEVAEFRQIGDGPWTVLTMFRAEGFAHDQGMIVGRMGTDVQGRWFEVRTTMGAAPQSVETLKGDFDSQIVGAASLQTGTWYLVAVSNDGGSPTATLTQYVFQLDGTAIDDGLTASASWAGSDDTVANSIGVRQDGGDPLDGDVAYSAYIRQELTRSEILSYLSDPDAFIAGLPTADVVWYHVLDDLLDDGPNGNDVTTIGTPTQVAGPTLGGGGTAVSQTNEKHVESLSGVEAPVAKSWESLATASRENVKPMGWTAPAGAVSQTNEKPLEYLGAVSATRVAALEYLASVQQSREVPAESVQTLAASRVMPMESVQSVAETNTVPLETVVAFGATTEKHVEYLLSVARTRTAALEVVRAFGTSRPLHLESVQGVSAEKGVPLETLLSLARANVKPLEFTSAASTASRSVVKYLEHVEAVSASRETPLGTLGAVSRALGMPVEHVISVSNSRQVPLEALLTVAATGAFPIAWTVDETIFRAPTLQLAISQPLDLSTATDQPMDLDVDVSPGEDA